MLELFKFPIDCALNIPGHTPENTTSSKKDPDVISQAVQIMRTDILAGLYHKIEHTDPEIQHQYCSIDWCKHLQAKRDDMDPEISSRSRLPLRYLKEILRCINERLSEPKLLARCVHGLTQNQKEAFNHTVWQRCPKKKKYGSAKSVDCRCNIGCILMKTAEIPARCTGKLCHSGSM